jgi:hypothetical protein
MLQAFGFAESMIKVSDLYDNNHIGNIAVLLSCIRHFISEKILLKESIFDSGNLIQYWVSKVF